MKTKFYIGNLIRKKRFDLFKYPTVDGYYIYSPYETVRTIDLSKNRIFINKRVYNDGSEPVIISEKEADLLDKKWLEINNKIIIENGQLNEFEHFREDNGEEKVRLNKNEIYQILFKYTQNNPDAEYAIYKCSVCNGIHLGKVGN